MLLKIFRFNDNEYVYMEGDDITNIYFHANGKASFVLPQYDNTKYINIQVGDHFGLVDIVGSCQSNDVDIDNWMEKKNVMQRQFTI